MQSQPVAWLEVVNAVGPYVIAIIAIVGLTVTAWLTHRYWLKQFVTEKSFILRQEKIRLLQEIPQKLMSAHLLAQQALVWRTLWEVIARLIEEQDAVPEEATLTSQNLLQKHSDASQRCQEMFAELYVLRITSRVYFGEQTGRVLEASLKSLQQLMHRKPEYEEMRSDLYNSVANILDGKTNMSQWLTYAPEQMQQRMKPLIDEAQQSISEVIQSMVEHLEKSL